MEYQNGIYAKCIKRLFDVLLSFLALVILSPIMLIIALLVRIRLGTPVVFKQMRPGLNENIFAMYKFRSMTDDKDEEGTLLPDSVRLTSFGKKLRATSLDELPELFNILKGDMSIVGPRPLLVKYLPLYSGEQHKRHNVRPGFTGLAQINGRNSISWQEKFSWDIEYAKKLSFLLDVKIVLKTVGIVIKKDGISSDTAVTMEEFEGDVD